LSLAGVAGRIDTTANTIYYAQYATVGNVWQLVVRVTGSATVLGTSGATLTVDQSYALVLRMRGAAISLLVDGAPLVSVIDASVSAPGKAGIRFQSNSAAGVGVHLDNWRAVQ
jgi:hypothetical protein